MAELKVSAGDLYLAYREAFSTQAGQIVMADLVRCFGYTGRTLARPDPHETYFNEGRRSVLIHIQNRLTLDPADKDFGAPQYDGASVSPLQQPEGGDDDLGFSD